VSWARDAVAAIRKIVLIEDLMETLTAQVKTLAESYTDIDRRLVRIEAKFELIEKMGAARRRELPAKSQRQKDSRKSE
jgi:negative regulator of replication initiation